MYVKLLPSIRDGSAKLEEIPLLALSPTVAALRWELKLFGVGKLLEIIYQEKKFIGGKLPQKSETKFFKNL